MRIFPALFRYKMPGGNIFRGKYKIVFPATPRDVSNLKYAFEIEEKNMFYLRNPYLTPASIRPSFCPNFFLIRRPFRSSRRVTQRLWGRRKRATLGSWPDFGNRTTITLPSSNGWGSSGTKSNGNEHLVFNMGCSKTVPIIAYWEAICASTLIV